MRSQVVVPLVCAVLGGATTATVLAASGLLRTGTHETVTQTVSLLDAGPVGGTAVGDVYRRAGTGVVGVTARSVPVSASAFDVGERPSDGVLTGSGFVVDPDGHVLTAAHLVRAASEVSVDVDGRSRPARVVGLDAAIDVAVLRIDPRGLDLHPLELGDSEAVGAGDPALGLARAPGQAATLVSGTIAARQPRLTAVGGAAIDDALQFDAPLHAGDEGGPLLDTAGRVIGLSTRMLAADGRSVEFAVPASTLRRVLPELRGRAVKVMGG
jgi:S1-C subfamily serine protease